MLVSQRYFIYLSYDGGQYCGWQIQPNGVTVQETLEKALSLLLQKETTVTGAGRTDSGVHARRMVAHFDSEKTDLDTGEFADKLNRILPQDISIDFLEKVIPEAHARFDAVSRTYEYVISIKKEPFIRHYAWRIHYPLDIEKMNEAAKCLFDYSDFTSFSKLHTDVKTNNCRIMQAFWIKKEENYIFTIQADRFLRNMVRAIVGTLVEVGRNKITIQQFRDIIEAKNRCKAGTSVPAQGLFLTDVEYPDKLRVKK
ncbi:MAG: tRNA pseudouridine(38-40) synthase TruA [Candidatus Azobacteroides sp.]|nr:tRNA pseudouridine(38-40) synthase TruA [Candidatus Azobacteroides sp.]